MTIRAAERFRSGTLGAVVCNLAVVYALFMVTRLVFVAVNYSLFADHLTGGYLMQMLVAGLRFDTSAILYLNAWMLLLYLLPLHYKEKSPTTYKVARWVYVIANFVALSANLCDCAYFPFTGRRTTWNVLEEFGNDSNILAIVAHEALPYWYLVVVGIGCGIVLWKCFSHPAANYHERFGRLWYYYASQLVMLVIAAGLTVGGMRGGFTTAVRPITISNANQYVNKAIDAGIVLNTPFSIFRTIDKKALVERNYMPMSEAKRLFDPVHVPSDSAQFKAMNVVVLICESFGTQAQKGGFMPFVDSLAHVGRSYEYSFANGRKSIDGMPSVLSSIPSFVEPFFLTPASLNDLSGIAGELSRHKGYHSAFFHGAENGSMGFEAFARSSGFQQYFGRTEYKQDMRYNGDADFDGTWAIYDEPFLQFYCDKMSEMEQPFVTAVFTASSHSPYSLPEHCRGKFKEGPTPLYACVGYSDNALRKFFDKASKQPWYSNTIFVLTADHATAADAIDPEFKSDQGLYRVPVIIYAPSMPHLTGVDTTRIASQADIMPTVLGMLGYDRPYVAFGQDLLNSDASGSCAINYLPGNDYFQYFEGDWMLQFDGEKMVHAFKFKEDPTLRHDLNGHHPESMERRMKSIIEQYMYRMNHNEMLCK